jgi:hypothetical protein
MLIIWNHDLSQAETVNQKRIAERIDIAIHHIVLLAKEKPNAFKQFYELLTNEEERKILQQIPELFTLEAKSEDPYTIPVNQVIQFSQDLNFIQTKDVDKLENLSGQLTEIYSAPITNKEKFEAMVRGLELIIIQAEKEYCSGFLSINQKSHRDFIEELNHLEGHNFPKLVAFLVQAIYTNFDKLIDQRLDLTGLILPESYQTKLFLTQASTIGKNGAKSPLV